MKKGLVTAFCLFSLPSTTIWAQSDFYLEFDIYGLFAGGGQQVALAVDMNIGDRYLAVNGAITSDNGLSSPATGTCFLTANFSGAFCNLQIDQFSYTLDLDSNLNGTITAKDANGFEVDSGSIYYNGF